MADFWYKITGWIQDPLADFWLKITAWPFLGDILSFFEKYFGR